MEQLFAVLIVVVAGIMAGLFTFPMTSMVLGKSSWGLEHTWLIYALFGNFIWPWILAGLTCPGLDDILAGSNDVESAQPLYDDEYENEEPTSYQPDNVDIPIVVEESQGVTVDLPSYDPVVLLVGTPFVQVGAFIKVSPNKFLVTICHRRALFDCPSKLCSHGRDIRLKYLLLSPLRCSHSTCR